MALTDKLALCLLADLKDDLGITDAGSDARLERRILAASRMIVEFLNRPVRREVNRIEYLPGEGGAFLLPALTPIESVASIEMDGEVIPATAYSIDERLGGIYSETGWEWTALGLQTAARELQLIPGTERRAFKVTFTGGWCLPNDTVQAGTMLPEPIAEACLQVATMLHRQRGTDRSVQGESEGSASIQFRVSGDGDGSMGGMPATVVRMLAPYRRAV